MTSFFNDLKLSMKNLKDEIDELKQQFPPHMYPSKKQFPRDVNSESFQTFLRLKKDVSNVRVLTRRMQFDSCPELEVTNAYFADMEDLLFEIEDEKEKLEKHLKKYGYETLNKESPPIEPPVAESKIEPKVEDTCDQTPKLGFLYHESQQDSYHSDSTGDTSEDKTPQLDLIPRALERISCPRPRSPDLIHEVVGKDTVVKKLFF